MTTEREKNISEALHNLGDAQLEPEVMTAVCAQLQALATARLADAADRIAAALEAANAWKTWPLPTPAAPWPNWTIV